jgi:hypothetical protein
MMISEETLEVALEKFIECPPTNAISLRSASSQIISKWIKSGRPYPHHVIDGFVYIESSIESSIEENLRSAVDLESDTEDAFKFHIGRFAELLKELKSALVL